MDLLEEEDPMNVRYLRALRAVLLLILVCVAAVPAPTAASTRLAPAAFDCSNVTGVPYVECQALVALYNSTNGAGWTHQDGWLATTTPCAWYGVTCAAGHVTL